MPKPLHRDEHLSAPLRRIRQQIAALDYICSGTLSYGTKKCGKPTCACAADPAAQHGPYYEWYRREGGRQVHTMVPTALGPLYEQAVQNYRKVRDLLRAWERESVRLMAALDEGKPARGKGFAQRRAARQRRSEREGA